MNKIKLFTLTLGTVLCLGALASAEISSLAFSKHFLKASGCWSCGAGGTNCPESKGSGGKECGLNNVGCSDQCNRDTGEKCQFVDGADPISCQTVNVTCPDGVDYDCVNNVCTDAGALACGTRTGCSL